MELVLYFLGEDPKQANRCCFSHAGYLLGICRPTWALTFQMEKHPILQFLHPLVLVH